MTVAERGKGEVRPSRALKRVPAMFPFSGRRVNQGRIEACRLVGGRARVYFMNNISVSRGENFDEGR